MLTPSTLTVAQGGSGTCVVSTALASGVPQQLQLSASLPTGVQAFFAPPAVMVGVNSLMTIVVGNVTPGSYPVTVTAAGSLSTHSSVLTLTVTASDFTL